ncbi:MAG: hypothetical protein ABJB40_11500 [Acidobacteriota bacterium]
MAPKKEVNLTDAVLNSRKEIDDKAREEKKSAEPLGAADVEAESSPDNAQTDPPEESPDAITA